MGLFHEQVEVVNRTCDETLEIFFDGQRTRVKPSYTPEGKRIEGLIQHLPRVVLQHALNQTVVMGSEDFLDPLDFQSKLGVVDPKVRRARPWHNTSFLTEKSTEITRVSQDQILEEAVADPKAVIETRGKKDHNRRDAKAERSTSLFDVRGA